MASTLNIGITTTATVYGMFKRVDVIHVGTFARACKLSEGAGAEMFVRFQSSNHLRSVYAVPVGLDVTPVERMVPIE